ncbi:MAG: hypothetical protein DI537_13920 [Stutzerimonas stutzeri]|nr:MAG: hypothetical protein DI537_13920 [Stutzerimonas stutzeri]
MSKKIDNAQTAYVAAIDTRLAVALSRNVSATNAIKLTNMRDAFATSSELCALFVNNKIDASIFERAIYALEKAVKFSAQLVNHKVAHNNVMMYCAFRTAINAHVNRTTLHLSDIVACCSSSIKVDDARKSIVYQNAKHVDDSTVKAQHQSSLDALRMLNIISERKDKRNEYDVNMNALAKALCDKLAISYEQIEEVAEVEEATA